MVRIDRVYKKLIKKKNTHPENSSIFESKNNHSKWPLLLIWDFILLVMNLYVKYGIKNTEYASSKLFLNDTSGSNIRLITGWMNNNMAAIVEKIWL